MQKRRNDVIVECVRGDITEQEEFDAVVNAANAQLAPGGGVAGIIHRKSVPLLYNKCKPLSPKSIICPIHTLFTP